MERLTPFNPYAAPDLQSFQDPADSLAADATLAARLLLRAWLKRRIEVLLPTGPMIVEYSGRSPSDAVWVDGRLAASRYAWWWFVPHFDFRLGNLPATIDVEVAWNLRIRRFELRVDGRLIYAEPTPPAEELPA